MYVSEGTWQQIPNGLRAGEWQNPVQDVTFTTFQGEDV